MEQRTGMARTRWAAIGAAIAVSLGAGFGSGVLTTSAASTLDESTFVSVQPVRILDTRPAEDIGLSGKFVSNFDRELQVTGTIDTADGSAAPVPAGATGVVLNVTAVRPAAGGYISVNPGGTTDFSTSNLNFLAGEIVPNAVTVPLSSDGKISIVYVASSGTGADVDVLVDLVGYTTRAGLLDINRRLNILEATSPLLAAHGGANTVELVATTDEVLATVEIPYQQVGTVLVNASVSGLNMNATDRQGRCSISLDESIDLEALTSQTVEPVSNSSISMTRGFDVSGSNTSEFDDPSLTFTANLVCDTTVGSLFLSDPSITAVYVPTDPETFAGG